MTLGICSFLFLLHLSVSSVNRGTQDIRNGSESTIQKISDEITLIAQ